MDDVAINIFCFFDKKKKTSRFYVTVGLFSNRSQITSKCGMNGIYVSNLSKSGVK